MSRTGRRGISPWVPNQHGAWAMLFLPVLTGMVTGIVVTNDRADATMWISFLSIIAAWTLGYFCFFAFGLWFKAASASRKKEYFTPVWVYGSGAAIAAILAIILRPYLLWWAIGFVPLFAIAVWEIYKNRPRSMLSGASTTVASSLMYLVMISVAESMDQALTWFALSTTALIAMYFVGTVFYVKSIIREKGNQAFHRLSIGYHVIALIITALITIPFWPSNHHWVTGILALLVMIASLVRAIVIPRMALENPQQWTPKLVGRREMPLTLVLGIACCFTFI